MADPIVCAEATSNNKYVTELRGHIDSVIAEDPPACFQRTFENYYSGLPIISADIGGQQWPIHVCGSTNTGWYLDGCGHGVIDPDIPCGDIRELTGEYVVAQGCILNCLPNILDPIKEPHVIVAEIGGQWYIVSVLDATSFTRPPEAPDFCFDNLCCPIGGYDIRATVTGCGSFNGRTFILEARNGRYAWEGSITVGGQTLEVTMGCDYRFGVFTANASCNYKNLITTKPFDVECGGTGTGSGTGGGGTSIGDLEGYFPTGGCCTGTVTISFEVLDTKFINRCLFSSGSGNSAYDPTGEFVIVDACNLPDISIDSDVIVAETYYPELLNNAGTGANTGTSTGTGTGTDEDTSDTRWHIVRVCDEKINCNECPQDPPPELEPCCGYTHLTAPVTLTAIALLDGSQVACNCPDEISMIFTLVAGSDPPEWIQSSGGDCNTPGSSTGSDDASVFLGFSNLRITCSGEGSSTYSGTGTGTGGSNKFYMVFDNNNYYSTNDNCDPVYMEFDFDVSVLCGAPPLGFGSLSVHIEVME